MDISTVVRTYSEPRRVVGVDDTSLGIYMKRHGNRASDRCWIGGGLLTNPRLGRVAFQGLLQRL